MPMKVTVSDEGSDRPTLTVTLEAAEIDALIAGDPLQLDAAMGGRTMCVELVREGGRIDAGARRPDVRLRLPPLGLNGVRVGGTLTPIFESVPFHLVLAAADGVTLAGPVRISPGVVYERLVSPHAPAAKPAPVHVAAPAPLVARPRINPKLVLAGLVIVALGVIGVLARKNVPLALLVAGGGA